MCISGVYLQRSLSAEHVHRLRPAFSYPASFTLQNLCHCKLTLLVDDISHIKVERCAVRPLGLNELRYDDILGVYLVVKLDELGFFAFQCFLEFGAHLTHDPFQFFLPVTVRPRLFTRRRSVSSNRGRQFFAKLLHIGVQMLKLEEARVATGVIFSGRKVAIADV